MKLSSALTALLLLPALPAAAAGLPRIDTPRRPATNSYHGVTVVDPYQWLEEAGTADVISWSKAQNERTRSYLDSLHFRDGLSQHVRAIIDAQPARYAGLHPAGKRLFALYFKPPAQQPLLVQLASPFPPALRRTVFDPNTYNTEGTTAIDWFKPSPDGRLVAICLSDKGSEDGSLHFVESATGKKLGDVIPRVQYPTGGGSVAWTKNGDGVFYTRYPHAGERSEDDLNFYQQVWFHRLGTEPSNDSYEVGKDFPRIAEIELESDEASGSVLAAVANGDGGDYAHFLRSPQGGWRQLTRFEDGVKAIQFGRDAHLYLRTLKDAPRGRILRMPLDPADLAKATEVVPQGPGVIQEFALGADGLFVESLNGGPAELRYFRGGRRSGVTVPALPISSIAELHPLHDGTLLFGNGSYTEPFGFFGWKVGEKTAQPTALRAPSTADFSDIEVIREFARSKDGTRVPVNILRRKGTRLDGTNPTLLYGYGGYGISMSPTFSPLRRVWFDAGGVYVVANLRGGGEFGEVWHKAGNLTRKQNVFDDFIASAEFLIHRGYTSPARLAVEGGSNGGLLMGAFLTQRPELARAVVAHVGVLDMLRVELDANGQFNITEFGTVKDPEHFKALYAYSPYHRVRDGTAYPAVLLATGENDGRVNPANSRKMAARLQAASSSPHPILYRSTATAGHGIGSSLNDRASLSADVYAFLFDQLGIDGSPWMWNQPAL